MGWQSSELADQGSVLTGEEVVANSRHPHQRLDCRLEHARDVQQAGFLPGPPHELQSDGQSCIITLSVHVPVAAPLRVWHNIDAVSTCLVTGTARPLEACLSSPSPHNAVQSSFPSQTLSPQALQAGHGRERAPLWQWPTGTEMAGMPAMLALIVNRISSPVWVRSVSPTAKASSLHKTLQSEPGILHLGPSHEEQPVILAM